MAERCIRDNTAIFAHPTQCQLYYNCSNDAPRMWRSFFDRYMEECPYPQLFSKVTNRCENYANVDCGGRQEHVDPCESIVLLLLLLFLLFFLFFFLFFFFFFFSVFCVLFVCLAVCLFV